MPKGFRIITRVPPKLQPRQINHQSPASGPKTTPSAQSASKRADHLRPSPGSGKPKQQQVY
jgi:hypothetical protein